MINKLFWQKFSNGNTNQIWDNIWCIEELVNMIYKIPDEKYPKNDTLNYRLDIYGRNQDMVRGQPKLV